MAAIVYDIYDGTSTADNDSLDLGFAPIYNTLTSDDFKKNRHYTSIYTFANQLPNHVPSANRAAVQTNLNALLTRHNIAGRGDDGAGETNRSGLPATARVLPVYKSITAGGTPIDLCSVDDNGDFNKAGNRAFVKATFTENSPHTLTLMRSGSRFAFPYFRLRPYGSAATTNCDFNIAATREFCTFTGNFRADEVAVLEAFEVLNTNKAIRELLETTTRDSCFTFSVVKTTQAPAAPTLRSLVTGDAQLRARWRVVIGASSYILYYSQSSLAGVTNLDTHAGVMRVPDLTDTSHTVTGLTNGTRYYFMARAVNAIGQSAASAQVFATPAVPTGAAPASPSLTVGDLIRNERKSPTRASRY